MTDRFVSLFHQPRTPVARGKYLARVFGIFSEEIVRAWAADSRAPYQDIGRPTVRTSNHTKGSTLDFTLRGRESGKCYVAEMKCEIEYQNYKYLLLTEPGQIAHHKKPAFGAFLEAARAPGQVRANVQRREVSIDGAILVWGAVSERGRAAAVENYGFVAVLAVAEMIADLQTWKSEPYLELLRNRRAWSNHLYDALANAEA